MFKASKNQLTYAAVLGTLLLTLLFLLPVTASAKNSCLDSKDSKLKIGVLYSANEAGKRHLSGVITALEKYPDIGCVPKSYINKKDGFESMSHLIKSGDVNIVIGPTTSDVYVMGIEKREELEKYKVPVISSLVIADVPHEEGGWFFRTNVDLKHRVETIYDYLNKYWISSISILYANTEWGRRAEGAFREELTTGQKKHYKSYMYNPPAVLAREQFRQILTSRPEVVGIFGERKDLRDIFEMLKRMNAGSTAYRPILFTIIDARYTNSDIDDDTYIVRDGAYIVTVTEPEKDNMDAKDTEDDVEALAYDTTMLILNDLKEPIKKRGDNTDKIIEDFRKHFEARLKGISSDKGQKTKMVFSKYKNISKPAVLHLKDKKLKKENLGKAVSLLDKVKHKINLTLRRYGDQPLYNVIILLTIVTIMSFLDIKKWYAGKFLRIMVKPPFLFFIIVTNLTVLAFYISMAETGNIRYDSLMATLVISFTPLALLRTSLFETAGGNVVGLTRIYERLLQWINDQLMAKKYTHTKKYINLIAYHNTVDGMKECLKEIFQNSRNAAQRVRLEAELDQLANDSISYAERRKVCARLLFRRMKYSELQNISMAPPENPDDLDDPEVVIKTAAIHCAGDATCKEKIDEEIETLLKGKKEERRKELESAHDKDIKYIVGEQGVLRRKIAFLFALKGSYSANYLLDRKLLTENDLNKLDEARKANIYFFQEMTDIIIQKIKSVFNNFKRAVIKSTKKNLGVKE
ncbi:MAG: ABC transporter substrate-binding protein [Nitrospirota bacterium]